MIDFSMLEKNMIDVIVEEQIKLGYRKEVIHLYYPLQSLNQIAKVNLSERSMQEELEVYFDKKESVLGRIDISHRGERFSIKIPESGVAYVHEHMDGHEFIQDFIRTIEKHGTTIQELLSVCRKYSDNVHFEKKSNGEFDYLIYFTDGNPDNYCYCITDEGRHLIYHRFSREDYESYGF